MHRDDIAARLKAATPGPWEASVNDDEDGHVVRMADAITSPGYHTSAHLLEYEHGNYPDEEGWTEAEANAELIAHAPTDIAWLLERADALAAALERICEESHTDHGMLDVIHHIAQGALAAYRGAR